MSQQHIDIWKSAAEAFDQRYQAIGEQWETSSTCEGWNVRELVDHAVGTQAQFTCGVVGAEVAEGAAWPDVYSAINTALETEGVLDGMTNHPAMGEVPKGMLFGIATTDLLIHAWDVARSVGADETLPAAAVSACYSGLQKMPEEMMRSGGRFGQAQAAADDADEQTQMLAFSGRQV